MSPQPFIRKAGTARKRLVAGQILHLLAEGHETANAFGMVICDSGIDGRPIPRHYHEREHDTWFCLRGKLQIWANDTSRVLTAGDFAYVPPGEAHSYQCKSPQTQFFGIVSPGGWEAFFDMAGDPWEADGLPEPGHPYDFAKMGPAMGKYDVHPVEQKFCAAENGDATDMALPSQKASYILQAGYGPRARLGGHLVTTLLPGSLCDNAIDMITIEGGRGATLPTIRHTSTHVALFVMNGTLKLTLDGTTHELSAHDVANIPAGVSYSTEITSGSAQWIASGGNGNGLSIFARAGQDTELTHYQAGADPAVIMCIDGIDAAPTLIVIGSGFLSFDKPAKFSFVGQNLSRIFYATGTACADGFRIGGLPLEFQAVKQLAGQHKRPAPQCVQHLYPSRRERHWHPLASDR
ncbi:MAG: quercetin 2,3-dioxygenase family protein [Cypionkella sp.]|nr:quercetin 2,3-dioxygenase family protein [Cypionkella sp.]